MEGKHTLPKALHAINHDFDKQRLVEELDEVCCACGRQTRRTKYPNQATETAQGCPDMKMNSYPFFSSPQDEDQILTPPRNP